MVMAATASVHAECSDATCISSSSRSRSKATRLRPQHVVHGSDTVDMSSSSSSSFVMANNNLWSTQRVVAIALILVGCILCLQSHTASAAPPPYEYKPQPASDRPLNFSEDNDCIHNDEVGTLCQKCAKYTKSNKVYPMCCMDQEEAREWCRKYIEFGVFPAPAN